jgi:hypothetical protein
VPTNLFGAFIDAFIVALLRRVQEQPDLVSEIRRAFTNPLANASKTFMTVAEYAAHIAMSKRTVETLIVRGLPVEKIGSRRRISIVAADAWIHGGGANALIERRAKVDARRSAMRLVAAPSCREAHSVQGGDPL